MKYRLGLDIGTNSIGWSVLEVGSQGKIVKVVDAGARIFSDGREDKTKSTLAGERRDARGARRRRDRFLQRQHRLINALTRAGLFPADDQERQKLQAENPLDLRARALSEKLALHQIGRALFHINQRRGFKSNRKDKSEETTSGKVAQSVSLLLREMELIDGDDDSSKNGLEKLQSDPQRSLGTFLRQRQLEGKQTRARPGQGEKGDLYDVYPTREIYLDEFNKIWDKQAAYYPEQMTDALKKQIRDDIIFAQRPLKPQTLGKCMYMSEEDRTFRAMPSFQRYRIYQEVNNLEWRGSDHTWHKLRDSREARDSVAVDMLEKQVHRNAPKKPSVRNAEISFDAMKKHLAKKDFLAESRVEFNFESPKRKGFEANLTSHIMQHPEYVGEQWHRWSLEKQDDFISVILDDTKSDEQVCRELQEQYGLSPQAAENCMNADAKLADGVAGLSLKAARLMLEKMRDGIADDEGEIVLPLQTKAAEKAAEEVGGFNNPARSKKSEEEDFQPLKELPYYGEAFEGGSHIIPGKREREEDKRRDPLKYYGGVTNTTVHIALNQIRLVVNELIKRYQHPDSIAIELGRDLPEGKEYRANIEKAQADNQGANRALGEKLIELGVTNNAANRLRLKLWKEQSELCVYSGKRIGLTELLSAAVEIDHIIPFSNSLDDSAANKVVCTRKANRDKGDHTPWEYFHNSPNGYVWGDIVARAREIKVESKQYNRKKRKFELNEFNNKSWRFEEDAMSRWEEKYGDDFLARHMNDTRYIGRLAKEYLELICHQDNIDVVTGRVTGLLRGHWGLNSILREDDESAKNRDDHRHHAVDAVIIGMTNRSMLQKISTAANAGEDYQIDSLFTKRKDGTSPIDPWSGFRDDVRKVINGIRVSHRINHKKQGQLHKESAYGFADKQQRQDLTESGENGAKSARVVFRKSIDALVDRKHVGEIRNKKLREEFLRAYDAAADMGKKGLEGVQSLAKDRGIRHLRVEVNKTVQPIRDKKAQVYKAYELKNNWATEIYQLPDSEDWQGVVISKFDASQKNFQAGVTKRPHPAARLVMRLFNNDMLKIVDAKGAERLMRIQRMSEGQICICEPQLANVANKERESYLVARGMYYRCVVSTLKKFKAEKIHISPTGLIRSAKR